MKTITVGCGVKLPDRACVLCWTVFIRKYEGQVHCSDSCAENLGFTPPHDEIKVFYHEGCKG